MAWTRKRALFAALIFALLAGALLFLLLRGSPAGETPPAPPQGLNRYALSLRLNPEEKSLAVSEALDFHNDTGDTLTTLVLRTWLNAYQTEETSPAALAPAAAKPAPGTAGELKLYDTDPRDAAMVMAIVADTLGKPLNELRFISIKEVKEDEI